MSYENHESLSSLNLIANLISILLLPQYENNSVNILANTYNIYDTLVIIFSKKTLLHYAVFFNKNSKYVNKVLVLLTKVLLIVVYSSFFLNLLITLIISALF